MSRFLCFACAVLLLLVTGPDPAGAQNGEDAAGLKCGTRRPIRYALVFDASASLRRHQESVVEAYTRLLRVLSEALCEGDRPMQVFAFPRDGGGHMQTDLQLRPGNGQRELARQVARQLLQTRTPHSDLPMVLRSVSRDVHAYDVIFFVTDGSYYPRALHGQEIGLDAVRDSLDVLAGLAKDPRLFVIGVRAEHEPALDPALRARLSPPADGDWRWGSPGGAEVELDTARGGALLHALFGPRYQPIEELSLPRFLFAGSHGAWLRAAGYRAGTAMQIGDLREVRLEHLVAERPADSATARCPRDPAIEPRLATAYGLREFCSIQAPDTTVLARLAREQWSGFAYLQAQVPGFDSIPASIYGYHQLILPTEKGACTAAHVQQYLAAGRPWPDSTSETGWVRLVHLGTRGTETVGLVPLPGTGCLVAGGRGGTPLRSTGTHLLYASAAGRVAVKTVELNASPLAWQPELRFWSGGFPPSNAAWLHVCVGLRAPLSPGERLYLITGERTFELRPPGAKKCQVYGGRQGHLFSSIIAMDGARRSGYLSVGLTGTMQPASAEIYPVVNVSRGYFLLPLWMAAILFGIGCLFQVGYWRWLRRRRGPRSSPPPPQKSDGESRVLRRIATLCRAGLLALILAEFVIVVLVTDKSGTFSHLGPQVLIGVAIYAAKLWVGFLLPEMVADELTS